MTRTPFRSRSASPTDRTSASWALVRVSKGVAAAVCLTAAVVACSVWGQQSPAADTSQGSVLVLKSGRVLRGVVEKLGDSYRVRWGEHGEVIVAENTVDLESATLEEAYHLLRARITRRSIASHISLAEWCLSNGMAGFAYDQLIEAMAIQPKEPRLDSLRRRIHTAQAAALIESAPPAMGATASSESSLPLDEQQLRRKVRELPAEGVKQYNIQIQPMLMASCATARCHGSGNDEVPLQLTIGLGGVTLPARHSNRNLLEVLEFVDREFPSKSRLLARAYQAHGTPETGEFPGLGDRQAASLEQWVYMMSLPSLRRAPTLTGPEGTMPGWPTGDDGTQVRPASATQPLPVNNSQDPFDPEVFNNRYRKPAPAKQPPSEP